MWAFKVLPTLFGLWSWFDSPLPASDVEIFIATYLVIEVPIPTVTITKTIGDRLSAAHSMATPQHSVFEFVVFIATVFAFAVMALWVAILATGKDRTMRHLAQVPRHIDASFRHTGCRIGYVCLLLAWVGLISNYWIGWSDGYVAWPKVINCLLSYPLLLVVQFKLSPIMRILLLCGRFAKAAAKTPGQWIVGQAIDWYEGRTSKRRIDEIFKQPISRISIAECLFPEVSVTPPRHSTVSQMLKALATDLVFFSWNLTIVVIRLRIRSWRQIPSHTIDIINVMMQVFFGFGKDDSFWVVWLGCYETSLKGFCVVLSVIWGFIKTSLGAIWMALKLGEAVLNRFHVRAMASTVPDELTLREIQSYNDSVYNAYCETSSYNWSQTALLFLRLHETLERIAGLEAVIETDGRHKIWHNVVVY